MTIVPKAQQFPRIQVWLFSRGGYVRTRTVPSPKPCRVEEESGSTPPISIEVLCTMRRIWRASYTKNGVRMKSRPGNSPAWWQVSLRGHVWRCTGRNRKVACLNSTRLARTVYQTSYRTATPFMGPLASYPKRLHD